MYVLVIALPVRTRILFSDDSPSPVGRVRMAGTLAASAGVRRRRFGSYALVYLVAGAGRFEDERGHDRAVGPGDLMLVFPGLEHSYGPASGRDWSELHIVFDGPVFDLWRERGVLDPTHPVHRLQPVDHWLGELESFVALPRPRSRSERELEVCRFLYVLTSMLERSGVPPTWPERARTLLASNLGERLDLERVAAELGMGYETFRKRFARETGTSPARYRSTRRLEVARELLTSTSMSHREIAASLGFRDEFHFSKRFKQWSGAAPVTVRQAPAAG